MHQQNMQGYDVLLICFISEWDIINECYQRIGQNISTRTVETDVLYPPISVHLFCKITVVNLARTRGPTLNLRKLGLHYAEYKMVRKSEKRQKTDRRNM